MLRATQVNLDARPLDRFAPYMPEQQWQAFLSVVEAARQSMEGRSFWNVSSTARGGGVAEMLPSARPGTARRWAPSSTRSTAACWRTTRTS
jgi:hypothetical protein